MKWPILEPPQHPHSPKLCGKRSISVQEIDMIFLLLQMTFFRMISHIFRVVKIRNFEIWVMFWPIYMGNPINQWISLKSRILMKSDRFFSKIESWDGRFSEYTHRTEHRNGLFGQNDSVSILKKSTCFFSRCSSASPQIETSSIFSLFRAIC